MTNFSTEQFLQEYFDALTADSNVEYEFWQSIMESIRSRNSIQQSMYETLEQLVNQRLDILRKDQLVAIYKETENWLSADEPSEDDLSIELIKIETDQREVHYSSVYVPTYNWTMTLVTVDEDVEDDDAWDDPHF